MCKIKCSKKVQRYYNFLESRTSGIEFEGTQTNRKDEIAKIAVLLGKYMQYRFPHWENCSAAVVHSTLRDWRARTKVSDACYDNVLLFLNSNWDYSKFLPITPAIAVA
ncbi:hypothetical protein GX656_03210 [Candidatus Dojkabacteria bacterium]|uniref:Uncharacterized protein n=1 Tax=Candidatus Dojkabacteria bacterium TaxID=2099670 RepID=A0A847D079_9BACT|nr:hypothetical protein [Candidatus Dojkabacteria bacterium]